MWPIINLILLIAFAFLSVRILSGAYVKSRTLVLPDNPEYKYMMDPKMFFVIFLILTGPFYLSQFALFKYGVFFLIVLYLLFISNSIRIPWNIIVISYSIFLIWLFVCAWRIGFTHDAMMGLIKYIIPLFALALGYSSIENKYDLYYLMKIVAIGAVIYVLLCGGISFKLTNWLYRICSNFIITYGGLTDYLASLSVIPLLLWWWTENKKWIWVFLIICSSPVLESVRTGLGASTIAAMIFCLFRFKWKSLPFIPIILIASLSIVIYVPSVREKFFGEDSDVTNEEIMTGEALTLDNMHTNGRAVLWGMTEEALFKGHEMCGSGLGEANRMVRTWRSWGMPIPGLLHNDYVQIKCDTGLIGLWLFIIFGATVFIYIGRRIWSIQDMTSRICGILALASSGSIAFSMGFDNVVSHSMSSMIIPFLFIGFFLKLYPQDNEEIIVEDDDTDNR